MARKKKDNPFSANITKLCIVAGLALGVGWFLCNRLIHAFSTSEYFMIKHVVAGPSLQFIHSRDLDPFEGKNIFTLDLKKVEARLERKYPQASQLRVLRKFPNRLVIVAKKRMPYIQVKIKDAYYILDDKAVVLAIDKSVHKNLPLVEHTALAKAQADLGGIIRGRDIRVGIRMQRSFQNYLDNSNLTIRSMDLKDLSKINVILSNDLRIIMDGEKVDAKMQILSLVLTQKDLDFKDVKYIDLRFKEPILGRK